jgi:prolyl-tRNA synthetase
MLMPLLHPKSIWNETGRWDKASEILYKMKDKKGKEYALSFTHEEIVMDILRKTISSYSDLPVSVYHFSTKFRNEPRARSGILRGREFLMKDLYSAHVSEEDMLSYYEKVKDAYSKVFTRIGFDFRITEAPGGVFTDKNTHEFQVLAEGGEDVIFYCDKCSWGENKEMFEGKKGQRCPVCKNGVINESKSIEVGNIFPLGKWYAEKMGVSFSDKDGKKLPVWFASYGIGPTRTMGAWVEVSHDKKGIIWNRSISPFDVHLVELKSKSSKLKTEQVYKKLTSEGIEALLDDRDVSAGVKFADADLIGIPTRMVVSEKTKDKVEWRDRSESKEEVISLEKAIQRLKDNI